MKAEVTVPEIKLYNTISRSIEVFTPLIAGQVGIYCCGPTVYNFPHIGNMRAYIFEDLLIRMFRYAGYDVKHVMNITDVGHLVSDADEGEDKMLVAVKREKKTSHEIAQYYTDVFFRHSEMLNIVRPTVVCRATDHVAEMIDVVKRLEEKGFAYRSGGNVYFDVSRFESYGELARLDREGLQAGARIDIDAEKRNPLDFALWFTKSKFENQELQWDSPWGRGYPGWHIECSAMSMKYLGETFDIHCGGIDHIPVHHTNEIAQSEAATGKHLANYWMHGAWLLLEKEKMSKSKGGFLTVDTLIERGIDPLAFRTMCLNGSYRSELVFSWEALQGAQNTLSKLRTAVYSCRETDMPSEVKICDRTTSLREQFRQAIFNDLALPRALSVLHETVGDNELSDAEKLILINEFDGVFGLGLIEWEPEVEQIPQEALLLAEQRQLARVRKDFAEADRIRNELSGLGFVMEDSKDGYKIRRI